MIKTLCRSLASTRPPGCSVRSPDATATRVTRTPLTRSSLPFADVGDQQVGDGDLPPGCTEVELTLDPTPTGTRLRLEHRNLPDSQVPRPRHRLEALPGPTARGRRRPGPRPRHLVRAPATGSRPRRTDGGRLAPLAVHRLSISRSRMVNASV